jgi:hypothetical protein
MMRVWMVSYALKPRLLNAGLLSSAAHVAIIAGWVAATLPPASMGRDSVANRLYYIPPPDRAPRVHGSGESIHYITLAEGLGSGPGVSSMDSQTGFTPPERSSKAGKNPADSISAPLGNTEGKTDSVFTVLQVDSAVTRSQNSAAPAYPLDLLKKNVEGSVVARYIVDTTGFADTTSLVVMRATDPAFVESVKEALPYMRFSPAKIGGSKVRQLVEQLFGFKIAPSVAAIEESKHPKP